MISHQKLEQITNCFAVLQINFDMKIVAIEKDLAAANAMAEKTGNLGYPVIVMPLPSAFIPRGHTWGQPNNK